MDKNEYLIDIASERSYQNQTRPYREAYTEWRNSEKNRFGYRFVHDSREHTYIDGEGFADKQAVTAEIRAVHSCLQFLGLLMVINLVLEGLATLILYLMFNRANASWVYFSQRNMNYVVPSDQMLVYCGLRIFDLTALLTVGNMILKLPRRVMLPHERQKLPLILQGSAVVIILTVILRTFDYGMNDVMFTANIDSIYYTYLNTSSETAQIMYYLTELFIVPLLVEMLFRGLVLQLFRQFGDGFAVVISSLAAACCYHELSKMMFIFILSVALGAFTVKTGSILPAMFLRMCTVNLLYFLNTFSLADNKTADRITEALISLFLIIAALLVLHMLRGHELRPFKLRDDPTELSLMLKLRQMLNSSWTVVWLIGSLLAMIASMRFI